MSERMHAEPGIVRKAHCDQDDKESIVDIYVSAESLKVYANPWVEGVLPTIPGSADAQHPDSLFRENSGRNRFRTYSVFLGAVCLLLLAGVISLGVHMYKEKAHWDAERMQLLAENDNLKKTTEQLTANNSELSKERDFLWNTFCSQKPWKCTTQDVEWAGQH